MGKRKPEDEGEAEGASPAEKPPRPRAPRPPRAPKPPAETPAEKPAPDLFAEHEAVPPPPPRTAPPPPKPAPPRPAPPQQRPTPQPATDSAPAPWRAAWRRDWLWVFSLVGVVLAVIGAARLTTRIDQPFEHFTHGNKPQLTMIVLGLGLFALGNLSSRASVIGGILEGAAKHVPAAPRAAGAGRVWIRRGAGVLLLAAGTGVYAFCIHDTFTTPRGLDGFIALFAAAGLWVGGAALLEVRRRSWLRDLGFGRAQRGLRWIMRDLPWLALYLAVWFGACIYRIDTRPAFFTGDEALVSIYGRQAIDHWRKEKLATPWDKVFEAYGSCIPRGVAFKMTPERPRLGPRLYTLYVSTALMGIFFVLARLIAGRVAAWIALLLFSTSHAVLYFARSGLTNLDSVLLMCLWSLMFLGAWRTRRLSLALAAGLIAGLAHYTYGAAMIVLPIGGVVLLVTFVRAPREVWARWALILIYGIGFAAASAPNAIRFRDTPKAQDWRLNSVFVLEKANLNTKFTETNTNTVTAMLTAYSWPAIGGAMLWERKGQPYDYGSPYIPIIGKRLAILYLIALAGLLTLWRRRTAYLLLAAWWLLLLVAGSLLTLNAPYIPRILSIYAVGGIMAGWALAGVVTRARRLGGNWLALPLLGAAAGYTGQIAYVNAHHYFAEFITDLKNPGYTTFPIGFTEFVRTFPDDARMVYWTHEGWDGMASPVLRLVDHDYEREEFKTPEPPPPPSPDKITAYIVRMPDFQDVDKQLRAMFPKVEPVMIRNPYRSDLPPTHHVYWVEPQAAAQNGAAAP